MYTPPFAYYKRSLAPCCLYSTITLKPNHPFVFLCTQFVVEPMHDTKLYPYPLDGTLLAHTWWIFVISFTLGGMVHTHHIHDYLPRSLPPNALITTRPIALPTDTQRHSRLTVVRKSCRRGSLAAGTDIIAGATTSSTATVSISASSSTGGVLGVIYSTSALFAAAPAVTSLTSTGIGVSTLALGFFGAAPPNTNLGSKQAMQESSKRPIFRPRLARVLAGIRWHGCIRRCHDRCRHGFAYS